jgi:hypothetical protein
MICYQCHIVNQKLQSIVGFDSCNVNIFIIIYFNFIYDKFCYKLIIYFVVKIFVYKPYMFLEECRILISCSAFILTQVRQYNEYTSYNVYQGKQITR